MHSTNSFIYTVIERIRGYLDDPDLDAKYTDDFLIRHIIMPSMTNVMARINNSLSNSVVSKLLIPTVANTQYYQLPPTVGEIWNVAAYETDTGNITTDFVPRGHWNPRGPNWALEGNLLSIRPIPQEGQDLYIFYTHTGDLLLHYGAGTLDSDLTTFTLSTSPTLGAIDKRANAYAGSILRLLSGNEIEERVVESSTANEYTGSIELTVRVPFDHNSAGSVTYEVAPISSQALYEAVAASGALKLASYKKITGTHFQMIQLQYKDAMKTAADHYANMQMRMPKHLDKDTIDNSDNGRFLT